MKVDFKHVEKKHGLVFKKKLHGLALTVMFSDEERTIIQERDLGNTVLIVREPPADVDAEKHASRGIVSKVATAALKGRDANTFDLTITKLLKGTDTYFFKTPLEAKEYEDDLRKRLPDLKDYIMENAGVEQKSDSFEL